MGGTSGQGGAGVGAGGAIATGGTSAAGGSLGAWSVPFKPNFMLGADISWTLEDEARGATYYDSSGTKKPLERIMAESGFNYIRMRTFVCPSCPGGYSSQGFCDDKHTVTWAKRVRACGLGILLDFHMSDTWASIGSQKVPSAWAGLAPAAMQTAAHDYVKGVLAEMVAAGVEPDMVQIGNETNSGMSGVDLSNWTNFSGLVNAGIKGVRDTDPKIIVMAQNGRPRDANFQTWVTDYLKGNPSPAIDEDGICGSTYGTTNGGVDWTTEFSWVINTYDKPVFSCEYTDKAGALINGIIHGMPKGLGLGTFIWEPTRYPNPNSSTLFTSSGNKYTVNAAMATYTGLAKSYGIGPPTSLPSTCPE